MFYLAVTAFQGVPCYLPTFTNRFSSKLTQIGVQQYTTQRFVFRFLPHDSINFGSVHYNQQLLVIAAEHLHLIIHFLFFKITLLYTKYIETSELLLL
jgi:hypothetical protein